MTVVEFDKFWMERYPQSSHLTHELRWSLSERWFRIHSLPKSKRYPDNEDEYAELLRRQNTLFNDLIGKNEKIVVTAINYKNDLSEDECKKIKGWEEFELYAHVIREDDGHETVYDVYMRNEVWTRGRLDNTLKQIADEEVSSVMFICPSKERIIAPYDGGVDVIVESTKKRDELKIKYYNWLSERADGL